MLLWGQEGHNTRIYWYMAGFNILSTFPQLHTPTNALFRHFLWRENTPILSKGTILKNCTPNTPTTRIWSLWLEAKQASRRKMTILCVALPKMRVFSISMATTRVLCNAISRNGRCRGRCWYRYKQNARSSTRRLSLWRCSYRILVVVALQILVPYLCVGQFYLLRKQK